MSNLNRELLATRLGKHITMFGGILNMKTSSLRYCVAGHLPSPLLVVEGDAQYLPGSGLPVGLFEDAGYEDARIRLPERFTLMGFSDGVLELLPQKQVQDKEAALLQLVAAGDGTLGWIAQRLGIVEGRELPDDITLMRISRHG